MIVYKATNKINGKCYIGQTRHSLESRKKRHLSCARQGYSTHFYQAIRKYGENNFDWEVLGEASTKEDLNFLETYFIGFYDSIRHGYTMVDGGDNNVMDIVSVKNRHKAKMQSAETRAKLSATMKRKIANGEFFTPEHRKHLSEAAKNRVYPKNTTKVKQTRTCVVSVKSGDTRSIGCYCVDEYNKEHHFHSYLDAGKWWYENYKPFPYSSCTYQRKIKQSIEHGYSTYGREPNKLTITNPRWYKGGDLCFEKVTN
jgi:group I intron endonuclease